MVFLEKIFKKVFKTKILVKRQKITKVANYTGGRKRGRGRPRNSTSADMGDLDVSLIREFEARPAFYDRNDPYFKDKIYCENSWEEISSALGYDGELYYSMFCFCLLFTHFISY